MNHTSIPTIADYQRKQETPDILFWVGCAGSFDERAKKITKAMIKIFQHQKIKFAVLGPEESCTGDPARRAGNEFVFQMQALQNINTLNKYSIKKIVTTCPHCFNTLKNEYPELGGQYETIHHTEYLQHLIDTGQLNLKKNQKTITYHDPCYLGRANAIYDAPRAVLQKTGNRLVEMKRTKSRSFCCGAGGGQLFKEPEKGKKEIHTERAREAMSTKADIVAVACPFCMIMMADGKQTLSEDQHTAEVKDIAELIAETLD